MRRLLSSLQFKLVVGFAIVLAVALVSVSVYASYAARRGASQFNSEVENSRVERIGNLLGEQYSARRGWVGIQPTVEQVGRLYGWRITVFDKDGRTVADSAIRLNFNPPGPIETIRRFNVSQRGQPVGQVVIGTPGAQQAVPEPLLSKFIGAVNMSLLLVGLTVGLLGVILIFLVSRRVLAPVSHLSNAAQRLGEGDLAQRVEEGAHDEVGELSRTFNSMAGALEEAERQRRSMVADIAHELRTPLSNIQGYIEAIRDGILQADAATLAIIYQQSAHLAGLVEDLQLLALAEAGALRLHQEIQPLDDLLRRSVESFRPRAEAKGVALTLALPEPTPMVNIDRTRISQVIANLLENGTRHTPHGGSVKVSATVIGQDLVRVSVADSGEGISPEDSTKVFDRFYRVDQSRARATGGSGLGLTIAKQLVNAHGGTISVSSKPGDGAIFMIDLPLTRLVPSPAPVSESRESARPGHACRENLRSPKTPAHTPRL